MLRRIEDLLRDAESENDAMGADEYLRRSYSSGQSTPEFTRLKEAKYLGYFAEQYNELKVPALVWARRNEAGSGHADFSVYDDNKSCLCDIEITALFTKPVRRKPQDPDPEDFEPYPPTAIPEELTMLGMNLRDIDHPRKGFRPYANLRRVVETHLRDKYPPYWLVIYDNERGVQHSNLKRLEELIQ
jgi:hypothetical protein